MDGLPFSNLQRLRSQGAVDVFAATDGSGAKVAVKTLDTERAAADPLGAARFRREAALSATLHHPGIVTCRGSGDGWLAFEWLDEGLDAPQRQRQHAEPSALLAMLASVADTLAWLHARGIVHADLKPSHIRFRGDRPVLIDLGIAALGSDDPLFAGEFAGSPRWMAPECLRGGQPTPAADIWSLCAIAAWLWNGAPAAVEDAVTILQRRLEGKDRIEVELAALAQSDAGLHAILTAGLGPPEGRPTAARLVQLISRSTAG